MKRVMAARSMPSALGVHSGVCSVALGMRVFSPFVSMPALRAEFPVLGRLAYLNAGTDGPLATRAAIAAEQELRRELEQGRAKPHFERRTELTDSLRATYARRLGCDPTDLALTTSTTERM